MIKINERYYINANSNCYVLQEKTKIQDKESKNYGKEIYKDLGYYVTIENLLNGVLKKRNKRIYKQRNRKQFKRFKRIYKRKRKIFTKFKIRYIRRTNGQDRDTI